MKNYPDAYLILDTKHYSVRNYQSALRDYADFVSIARNVDAYEVMERVIPEIYNQAMAAGISLAYPFSSYLYSLWEENYSMQDLEDIALFCHENGMQAVTMNKLIWNEEVQKLFEEKGISVILFMINDKEEADYYLERGVAGFCTDWLCGYSDPGSA